MSEKLGSIIEQLKSLTLLEASQLVTEIETVFGVDTSVSVASVGVAAPVAGDGGAAGVTNATAGADGGDGGLITLTDITLLTGNLIATSGAGKDVTAVTASLINHQSGDVMFIENKTATSRATDQVETVRLVIAF